jgi:hypothetical protein
MPVFWVLRDDCREKVRPGTVERLAWAMEEVGRSRMPEPRAPTVGALGDAWSNCRECRDEGIYTQAVFLLYPLSPTLSLGERGLK